MLLITPGFSAGATDGNCIPPLQLLVRHLLKKGVTVHIIALEYPFTTVPYVWGDADTGFAHVYPCNGQNRRWRKIFTFLRGFMIGRKVLANSEDKRIHSFWLGWAALLGLVLEYIARGNHYCTLMGQDALPGNPFRWLLSRLIPSRKVIALSAFHARQFGGSGVLHIIPWGVDDETVEAPDTGVEILGVGSLLPVKQWDTWLQVVAGVARQRPGVRALLIGDGPEKSILQQRIAALGLQQHLRLAGTLPRAQVLGYMRASRVLLHTARYESFGYVLAEAARNGMHIVSTPVGIAPETSDCCAPSVEELTALVLKCLSETGAPAVRMPCSMAVCAERYLDLADTRQTPH